MWFRSGIGDFLVLSPFVIGLLCFFFFGAGSFISSVICLIFSILTLWGILKAIDAVKASFQKDEKLEEKKEPN